MSPHSQLAPTIAVAAVVALAGAARADDLRPLFLKSEPLNRPPLAETVTVQAGEAVIETGVQNTYDGLELSSEINWGDGVIFRKAKVLPGKLKAALRDKKYVYYVADRMTENTWPKPVTPLTESGVCTGVDTPATDFRIFFEAGHCAGKVKPPPTVRPIQIVDVDPAKPYRALIYSGRSGDWVSFLYRQSWGDPAHPPVSQDMRFDLTKGATVEAKGARLEIIDAKPDHLTYRVVASFADDTP